MVCESHRCEMHLVQGKYAWLRQKHGWVLEIRAGGENFSKMFKVKTEKILRLVFFHNTYGFWLYMCALVLHSSY